MVISGNTRLIAHLGYPTASFKAPMIYNPWFVDQQVDVKVVPMGVRPEDYAAFIPPLFTMTNIIGALVTMPHKIATCDLVQRLSPPAAATNGRMEKKPTFSQGICRSVASQVGNQVRKNTSTVLPANWPMLAPMICRLLSSWRTSGQLNATCWSVGALRPPPFSICSRSCWLRRGSSCGSR